MAYATSASGRGAGAGSPRALLSDYGYMTDPADPSCTYGLGHAGLLFRFDTATGDEGCARMTWQLPDPKASFCDGAAHPITWSTVTILGRPANLTGGTITIGDGATTLLTIPVTAANAYPINMLAYPGAAALTVSFAPLYTGAPPTTMYQLQVGFTADASPQICYQARTSCPAGEGYTNAVTFAASATPGAEGFSVATTSQLRGTCTPPSSCCPPLAGGIPMADMFTHTLHPAGTGYRVTFDTAAPATVNLVAGYQAYLPLLKFLCPTVHHLQVTFIPHTAASIGGAWTGVSPASGFTSFSMNIGSSGPISGITPANQFGPAVFAPGAGAWGVEAQTRAVDVAGHPVGCGFVPAVCDDGDRFTWKYNVGSKLARPMADGPQRGD